MRARKEVCRRPSSDVGGEPKKSGILEAKRGGSIKREEVLKWNMGNLNKKTESCTLFSSSAWLGAPSQAVVIYSKAAGIHSMGLAHWNTVF